MEGRERNSGLFHSEKEDVETSKGEEGAPSLARQ